ncbi:30S ribosomal protein S16 [Candidatus Saccharibacteria bacterium]|nr:30S ribosomal protein S16 [Candidatus Saccharibacteria bacterium]
MQRTGRSGHAQFRVIVQDSRFSPTRGRVVSYLGSYNPHTKMAKLDSLKASQYLANGAQPSDTVARLFQKEGIKLPDWVRLSEPKKRVVRHPDKRRVTAPTAPEAKAEPAAEASTDTEAPVEAIPEAPAESSTEPIEAEASEPEAEEQATSEPAAEGLADSAENSSEKS